MISRRCASLSFTLVAAMNFLCNTSCHPKAGDKTSSQQQSSNTFTSVAFPLTTLALPRSSRSPIDPPAQLELPQSDMGAAAVAAAPDGHDLCYKFSRPKEEDGMGEFYSPGYPDNYTSNIKCYLKLTAPPGHVIVLDFRDYFALEPSPKCKNDFLEVIDGEYGFDKPLKNSPYCGFDFPPELTSSDRHLWIHFKSDENIEYKGFKAVYKYKPRPANWRTPERLPCRTNLTGVEGNLNSELDINNETRSFVLQHKMPLDCLWEIIVEKGWRIQLALPDFKLHKPNDCESNFLDIFSDLADMHNRDKNFCGSMADTVTSKNNTMYVRFFTDHSSMNDSLFKGVFTAFKEIDKHSNCGDDFDCDDGTCISPTLKCNRVFNCRFRWDEENCDTNKKMPFHEKHIVIIMVIFSLILSGMCFTFIFNCVKKIIRDHRAIQEYIRQSREQQLNELEKQEPLEKKSKVGRSGSNSTQSSESHRFGGPNVVPSGPCYVPGGELLPILIRNDHVNSTTNVETYNNYDDDNPGQPEMCDSACQTRESLFQTNAYSSGHSTPNHSITSTNSKPSPPAPFSTFGYKKENKYRAEARIEMESVPAPPKIGFMTKFDEKRRPYSVQTTKSAPDVIVTH